MCVCVFIILYSQKLFSKWCKQQIGFGGGEKKLNFICAILLAPVYELNSQTIMNRRLHLRRGVYTKGWGCLWEGA